MMRTRPRLCEPGVVVNLGIFVVVIPAPWPSLVGCSGAGVLLLLRLDQTGGEQQSHNDVQNAHKRKHRASFKIAREKHINRSKNPVLDKCAYLDKYRLL